MYHTAQIIFSVFSLYSVGVGFGVESMRVGSFWLFKIMPRRNLTALHGNMSQGGWVSGLETIYQEAILGK
jgi:hypothetical protein